MDGKGSTGLSLVSTIASAGGSSSGEVKLMSLTGVADLGLPSMNDEALAMSTDSGSIEAKGECQSKLSTTEDAELTDIKLESEASSSEASLVPAASSCLRSTWWFRPSDGDADFALSMS